MQNRIAYAAGVGVGHRSTRIGGRLVAVISAIALTCMASPLLSSASAAGPQWSTGLELTPPPGAATNPGASLYDLACLSQGNCTAVGQFATTAGAYMPAIEIETGGSWNQATTFALPSSATGTPADQNADVDGVACTGVGDCVAVGSYTDTANRTQAMVAGETGGSWSQASELSLPTGADTTPQFARLDAVFCASAGNCTAVGYYYDGSTHLQAMVAGETNGTWGQASELSLPANAGSNPYAYLTSLSCTAAGDCVAAGYYTTTGGTTSQPMIAVESGGSWSQATELTQPSDSAGDEVLNAVSCVSAGNCTAAGFYFDSGSADVPVVDVESAGTWAQGTGVQLPTNAVDGFGELGFLQDLSCTSPGDCVAAGYYSDSSQDDQQAMTVTESGGVWAQGSELSLPSNAQTGEVNSQYQIAALNGLDCQNNTECTAVGEYQDTNGYTQAMAVGTTGGSATQAPEITSPASTNFTAGQAGSFTVEASGVPGGPTLTLSDGGASLPSGVSFVDNGDGTATLSGTPSAAGVGSYPFTITAANGVSPSATQAFTLTVEAAGSSPHPIISTGTATNVTATSGTLNWTVQPDGDDLYYYNIVCQPSDGGTVVRVTATTPTGSVAADHAAHALATPLSGLRPGITYACGLGMGDSAGHNYSTYPAVEVLTTLTPKYTGFSVAPLVTSAQLSWAVNPGGDSLKSYSVACTGTNGNASTSGSISARALPADEAAHELTVTLRGLSPAAGYVCVLSVTDAEGLVFADTGQSFSTGSVTVSSTTYTSGVIIAIESACGGSTGTPCSGNGEDVSETYIPPHAVSSLRGSAARATVLGRFRFRIKAHHHATIRFGLTRSGHRLLVKHHTLATTLIITVTVHGKKVTTHTPLRIIYRKR
jgi:hypothetical protein